MIETGDYISREAVLSVLDEAVKNWRPDIGISKAEYLRIKYKNIPAADVRPVVRGKWEDVRVRDYSTNINGGMELHIATMFCPVCGRWHNEVYHYGIATEMAHFCPNCGADMRPEPPKEEE